MISEKRWDFNFDEFSDALVTGVERMTAWADLLDQINVFPVADGDTGRNLAVSLSPLRHLAQSPDTVVRRLMFSARGNSGNIAAHFFSGFLDPESRWSISRAAELGRQKAWRAVSDPRPGTMLTVFDTLADTLKQSPALNNESARDIVNRLEQSVLETPEMLPELKAACVVDAGALGMFIFFEGLFMKLAKSDDGFRPVTDRFKQFLQISSAFKNSNTEKRCVDMIIHSEQDKEMLKKEIAEFGDCMVAAADDDHLKIHLHVQDTDAVKTKIQSFGRIVSWSDERIMDESGSFMIQPRQTPIHIMTDAAGSLTLNDARRLGITVLNSYILTSDGAYPETMTDPSAVYPAMRRGETVTTAQASVFERQQYYESLLNRYDRVLYLCVGSVYTGNYDVARAWKTENDPDGRFTIIDTGAASGRLAMIAISVAEYAAKTDQPADVIRFAELSTQLSREYIFLDRLQYLAAGGRISKTGAFFGDMLHIKPIISPAPGGVQKAGTARSEKDQIRFALDKLADEWKRNEASPIMLEYSDNRQWVETRVKQEISDRYPGSDILIQPLSLTSGVHMGPGTWGVAFITDTRETKQ